jgi:hypothetical protein
MEVEDNEKFPAKTDLSVPTGKAPTQQYYQSISLVGELKLPPFKMANFQDPTTDSIWNQFRIIFSNTSLCKHTIEEDNFGCPIIRLKTYSSKHGAGPLIKPNKQLEIYFS